MPSKRGYWIGGALAVLGPVIALILIVTAITGGEGARIGDTRVQIPGDAVVALDAEKYIVYYEERGTDSETISAPTLDIDVRRADGDGAPLPVSDYLTNLTVSSGGRTGIATATIEPRTAGSYRFRVSTAAQIPEDASAVLGKPFAARWAVRIGLAVAAAGLGLLIGGTVLLLTFVRRRRAKRGGGAQPPWPGPGGGGGGGGFGGSGPGWQPQPPVPAWPPGGGGSPQPPPPAWPPGGGGSPPPPQPPPPQPPPPQPPPPQPPGFSGGPPR